MIETRNLAEIKEYLYCPTLFYWNRLAVSPQKQLSTLELPKLAIRQALSIYIEGDNDQYGLEQWVDFVWKTWLEQSGVGQDDVLKGFQGYHKIRYYEILKSFFTGETRAPNGKKYIEPRASKAYKDRYLFLNLSSIEDELSQAVVSALDVVEVEITHLKLGKYSVAQAYSDSLIMAMNFIPPAIKSVWGVGEHVNVRLDDHVVLDAVADLIVVDKDKSQAYFLDGHPMYYLDKSWVWRRPDLLAASLMEAREGSTPFPPVETVFYVHLLTGEVLSKKTVNANRLKNVFIMANRGISANVFPPAFLSDDHTKCRACEMRPRCYDQEDILESVFPGSYQTAQALDAAINNPEAHKLAVDLATKLTPYDFRTISGSSKE